MSSPDTTTAAPSLPGNWVPSKAGCLNTKDWWIWSWNGGQMDARTVLGGPSQTDNCFPSRGEPTGTYVGTQCPPNYTSASCSNTKSQEGAITCCPNAYAFSCVPEPFSRPHLDWFRCISKHGTSGSPTVTMTDFQANTQKIYQPKQDPDQHLFAIAMVYQTPSPTSASTPGISASASSGDAPPSLPSETGPSQPASSEGSNGLSAGASGGIGVGAGVGVLLLGLIGFLLWRRRRDKTRGKTELPTTASSSLPPAGAASSAMAQNTTTSQGLAPNAGYGYGEQQQQPPATTNAYGTTGDAAYWDARAKHEALQSTPSPVPTGNDTMVPGRHEMYSGDARSELPDYRH
ncbi:hypothetical protein PG991_013975 [Apiospora marii]|uniref:Uncharacterized protein n=1 Tax=Apiospora marii TaxID=335849 RepID=A0ABR1R7Q0_9PEZI